MRWLWRYLTYERGARLITGDVNDVPDTTDPAMLQAGMAKDRTTG